jgi:ABC-2 type transport system ATP-binding protein
MTNESMFQARGLRKTMGGRAILKGLELDIAPGQVVGLLGKNGAGKSTLIDLMLGFAVPTEGTSRLFGEESARLSDAVKGRIGFVAQLDELMPLMTGAQHLALTASFHRAWDAALIARLAKAWEVPLDRRIGMMSGGERQKLATLMAMGHRPAFLVMDEPVSGLDPVARRQFMQAVLEIAAEEGRTILFSSHIVSDLERVSSHLWILREGELAWRGEVDALKESVVRVHLRSDVDLPPDFGIPGTLQSHVAGRTATLTVRDWRTEHLGDLERRTQSRGEVETLGLEDIFLAMHA